MALFLKISATATVALALSALLPAPASAIGTISIQRYNGTKDTYGDVEIKIFAGSLFLTSEDGHGTIVVTRAACSYQGQLMVCLPTTAALVQEGESDALNLKTGTIYYNYTNESQQLASSSAKVPANSILVALTLKDGTYIDVRGRVDEVIEQ